jgi:hypothetical protein
VLFPMELGYFTPVDLGPVNKQSIHSGNSKKFNVVAAICNSMLVGLTVAPAVSDAAAINEQYRSRIECVGMVVDSILRPDINSHTPGLILEDADCCDLRADAGLAFPDLLASSDANELAMQVFSGSRPMQGVEYAHLARLVRKNATQRSTIPGML